MTEYDSNRIALAAAELLRKMVVIPSFSGEESEVADLIEARLRSEGVNVNRWGNNLWALAYQSDDCMPVIMMNSHIDTVRASSSYTFDPFNPDGESGKVRGLGSNDAGASVVCMTESFLQLRRERLPFNIMLALSAEEENSGPGGMRALFPLLPKPACAIIGEPTKMEAAIAERGLLVIDAVAKGVSGHAAREEGVNAILAACRDIEKIMSFKFNKESNLFGAVKVSITRIEAGREHNVIPDKCHYTLDIRPNELYSNEEIFSTLEGLLESTLKARSFSNKCSMTPEGHELIQCAKRCGIKSYVSPTTSDWMRISVPAIKMGPGDSSRSHKADEYVTVEELRMGIEGYMNYIKNLNLQR
ncbi:MAG: acetylornithine deacetylase [Bacteroidetes bacterium 41-46]|mgnify:FL=1|nr:MAG: acetylornithine deacetylase [Bacteroidetes bacterium 41-46]